MVPQLTLPQGNSLNEPVILEVAKAISAHLELSDVLGALHSTLKPMVEFDAIGVVIRDGDYAKLHSLYIQGFHREGHESVQSMLERKASELHLAPLSARVPINDHYLSAVLKSGQPYVCADVEHQRRFRRDDDFLKYGIHSYVALPLTKHGELLGVVD